MAKCATQQIQIRKFCVPIFRDVVVCVKKTTWREQKLPNRKKQQGELSSRRIARKEKRAWGRGGSSRKSGPSRTWNARNDWNQEGEVLHNLDLDQHVLSMSFRRTFPKNGPHVTEQEAPIRRVPTPSRRVPEGYGQGAHAGRSPQGEAEGGDAGPARNPLLPAGRGISHSCRSILQVIHGIHNIEITSKDIQSYIWKLSATITVTSKTHRKFFSRLVREIVQDIFGSREFRWRQDALHALQTAAEAYMTRLLSKANVIAIHAKRVTLQQKDLEVVQQLFDIEKGDPNQMPAALAPLPNLPKCSLRRERSPSPPAPSPSPSSPPSSKRQKTSDDDAAKMPPPRKRLIIKKRGRGRGRGLGGRGRGRGRGRGKDNEDQDNEGQSGGLTFEWDEIETRSKDCFITITITVPFLFHLVHLLL